MQTKNKILLLTLALIIIGVSFWVNSAMLKASDTNGRVGSGGTLKISSESGGTTIIQNLVVDNITMSIGDEIFPENVFTGFIVISGNSVVVTNEGKIVAVALGQAVVKKFVINSQTQIKEGEFTITVI